MGTTLTPADLGAIRARQEMLLLPGPLLQEVARDIRRLLARIEALEAALVAAHEGEGQ